MNRIVDIGREELIVERRIEHINTEKRTVSYYRDEKTGQMIPAVSRSSPTVNSYVMKADTGEQYRFTRSSKHALRDDYPVAVQGIKRKGKRAEAPMVQKVGIKPHREDVYFVEIEFADGRKEEASFVLQSEVVK